MAARVYHGGRVLVCDGTAPTAEAIVVDGDRIAGVGSSEAMRRLADSGAEAIDLRGATVMPGLIDTHPHLMHFGAFAEPLVDIADARSHDDIVARVRTRAET